MGHTNLAVAFLVGAAGTCLLVLLAWLLALLARDEADERARRGGR